MREETLWPPRVSFGYCQQFHHVLLGIDVDGVAGFVIQSSGSVNPAAGAAAAVDTVGVAADVGAAVCVVSADVVGIAAVVVGIVAVAVDSAAVGVAVVAQVGLVVALVMGKLKPPSASDYFWPSLTALLHSRSM